MPQNNTWINSTTSRCVVVFVHGILSDSNAWRNKKAGTYWPAMLSEDPQFEDASVFVGGYTAGLGAGLYDVYAAANDVLANLRSPAETPSPLDKDAILFVCHSQGGIVVRQMLTTHFEEFATKKIGMILCGSPSWGSHYATFLAPITLLLRFRQATALRWGASTLRNLDRDFLNMMEAKRIPKLVGLCLVETRGRFLGIPFPKIVSEVSATRYFSWQPVAHTTHGSLVKPSSRTHGSYVHTRDFAHRNGFLTRGTFAVALRQLLAQMIDLEHLYDPTKPGSQSQKSNALAQLSKDLRTVYDLRDRFDRLPQAEFEKLMKATIDAGQSWAFDDFTHDQFTELRIVLNQLLNDLIV